MSELLTKRWYLVDYLHMETRDLTFLGLSEKAGRIYQAGLLLGTTSVQDLARKSELKRPTVYLYLDELVKQGLFEIVPLDKKVYYRASNPEVLEERLKKQLLHLQTELPRLTALRSDTMGKPQIRIIEGKEGVSGVYDEMKKANSLRFWSNIGATSGLFHNEFMELAEALGARSVNNREIIADTKESKRYSKLISKVIGPTYSARIATVEGIENDTGIFGDVVVLFRLHELNLFVVRIEDKTIASTMRAIFDMSWKTARPF